MLTKLFVKITFSRVSDREGFLSAFYNIIARKTVLLYHPYRMVRVNDVAKIMIFTLKNSQNKCHLQLKEFAKMKVKLVLDKSDFLIIFFFFNSSGSW